MCVVGWEGKSAKSVLGVRIRLAEKEFFRTKIIEIYPFWVLNNSTDFHISVTQDAFGLDFMAGIDILDATQTVRSQGACEMFVSPWPQGCSFGLKLADGRDKKVKQKVFLTKIWEYQRRTQSAADQVKTRWSAQNLRSHDPLPFTMNVLDDQKQAVKVQPIETEQGGARFNRIEPKSGWEWLGSWTESSTCVHRMSICHLMFHH
eukprot:SAG31_NODE_1964_length_6799_cov_2.549552_9_plen_204_part_00